MILKRLMTGLIATAVLVTAVVILAADLGMFDETKPKISYDPAANTIVVKNPGASVTLTDIHDALPEYSVLDPLENGGWHLKANLRIGEGVTLLLHGRKVEGDVDWLKLQSGPDGFVYIRSVDGIISLNATRVTSWYAAVGSYDMAYEDGSGRAYIAAKNYRPDVAGSRMDVINSEIAYMGYPDATAYGITWRVSPPEADSESDGSLAEGISGDVLYSKLHHNYFGLYTSGAKDMRIVGNDVYDNAVTGLDPPANSRNLTIENNDLISQHDHNDNRVFCVW